MVFPDVIFFFLLSFFQALASHLDQRIHISEEREKEKERKKKAKGKGNKNERKRNGKGNEKGQEKRKGKRTGKRKGEGKGRVKEETGKRKGKGEEKGKKGSVSHGPFLMPKVIVFVVVLLSFVKPVFLFFSGNGCNHQKRSVATTYQAPSLRRICAITTTNNERKRPKALNSRRMMEKLKTLDFKSLDTDH